MTQRSLRLSGLTWVVGLATLFMAGCASRAELATEQDGRWCYTFGRSLVKQRTQTCTSHAVPDRQADLQAKAFNPEADAVTVYVVRRSIDDYRYRVPVVVDGQHSVDTLPESYVRLRLRPGTHTLAISWRGQVAEQQIDGQAGDIRMLQVAGTSTDSDSQFAWGSKGLDEVRQRVLKTRLVVDRDLR